jgi:hypothetical protein
MMRPPGSFPGIRNLAMIPTMRPITNIVMISIKKSFRGVLTVENFETLQPVGRSLTCTGLCPTCLSGREIEKVRMSCSGGRSVMRPADALAGELIPRFSFTASGRLH